MNDVARGENVLIKRARQRFALNVTINIHHVRRVYECSLRDARSERQRFAEYASANRSSVAYRIVSLNKINKSFIGLRRVNV